MPLPWVLANVAFGLLLASFVAKDILWLRCLCVLGYGGLATANYMAGTPHALVAFGWAVVFIAVHAAHIVVLVHERRGVSFSQEEQELYDTTFASFAPFEFMKLMRLARLCEEQAGAVLAREGEKLDAIMLIYNGRASVRHGGKDLARLRDGDFVGEISFANEGSATADVVTDTPTKLFRWEAAELRALLARNPSMRPTLLAILHQDMAKKLTSRRASRVSIPT